MEIAGLENDQFAEGLDDFDRQGIVTELSDTQEEETRLWFLKKAAGL